MVQQRAWEKRSRVGLALPAMGRRKRTNAVSNAARKRRRRAELERNLDRARWHGDASARLGFPDDANRFLEKQSEQRPVSDWLESRASRSARRVHGSSGVGRSGAEAWGDHVLGGRGRCDWNSRWKSDQGSRLSGVNRIRGNARRASPIDGNYAWVC